jgi:transcriptional regulator
MAPTALPIVQGTLDLLVLRTLSGGANHGYGIAVEIARRTDGTLAVEDAALYQSLHRLFRHGHVDAEWRASDNNRRARYYSLTAEGRARLRSEAAAWRRYAKAVDAVLAGA